MTLRRRAEAEVEELHRFFSDWFAAMVANTEPVFARLDLVLAPSFRMITPAGVRRSRDDVVGGIRRAYGSGPVSMWVEGARAVEVEEGLAIVVYEEWQDRGKGPAGRVASALMRHMQGLPNDVQWLHLHETRLG